jgi:hypothetical protein
VTPDGVSGAGGGWPVHDEVADPSIIRQRTSRACGNACGATLLVELGLEWVLQCNVAARQGSVLSRGDFLAEAMNSLLGQPRWRGGQIDVWAAPLRMLRVLLQGGAVITSVRSAKRPEGRLNHMVIVDSYAGGRVQIRDPAEGTSYWMTWRAFRRIWQGDSVWVKGASQ